MPHILSYKGYHASCWFSSEDGMLVGCVIDVRDSLNFHGKTVPEITQSFHDSIDNYLEFREELRKKP